LLALLGAHHIFHVSRVRVNTVSVGQPALKENRVISLLCGQKQETANVSEMYICHIHFACEISHNYYLQSPVYTIQMVLVSKSCKHLQYVKKFTPASAPKTVSLSVKQSNFMTPNVMWLWQNLLRTDILSIPQPTNVSLGWITGLKQMDLLRHFRVHVIVQKHLDSPTVWHRDVYHYWRANWPHCVGDTCFSSCSFSHMLKGIQWLFKQCSGRNNEFSEQIGFSNNRYLFL
jgi:hypothetical protein